MATAMPAIVAGLKPAMRRPFPDAVACAGPIVVVVPATTLGVVTATGVAAWDVSRVVGTAVDDIEVVAGTGEEVVIVVKNTGIDRGGNAEDDVEEDEVVDEVDVVDVVEAEVDEEEEEDAAEVEVDEDDVGCATAGT